MGFVQTFSFSLITTYAFSFLFNTVCCFFTSACLSTSFSFSDEVIITLLSLGTDDFAVALIFGECKKKSPLMLFAMICLLKHHCILIIVLQASMC